MRNKFLLMLISLLLLVSLVACDSQAPSVPKVGNKDTTEAGEDGTKKSDKKNDDTEAETTASTTEDDWLNIATYNIWHCGDLTDKDKAIKPDNIVNFMQEYDIDIIGMNEVDVNCARSAGFPKDEYYKTGSNQPEYIANQLTQKTGEQYYWAFAAGLDGYHSPAHKNFNEGKAQYGNAIVSKYPIVSKRSVLMATHKVDPDNPQTQTESGTSRERRVLLIAEIAVNDRIITVISTHFGLLQDERELAVETLKGELKKIKTPVIFMGDLNCGYDSDIIQELNTVLKPTSVAAKPGTFVSSGARIDYIFTSDNIATKDLTVPKVYYSDHFPVVVKALIKPTET